MSNSKPQADFIKTQTKIYFQYLQTHIATNSMVSKATGIPQKNLTRYKRYFEKRGMLKEVYRKFCMLTGFRASYLTTNPDLMRKSINTKKS